MHKYDKVSDILKTKQGPIWSLPPQAMVYEALELIARYDIGSVLVMQGSELLGVFSEREYARNVALHGKSSRTTEMEEVMLAPPYTVSPDTTVAEAMGIMTDHHTRHLPVTNGKEVVGLISMGDVVKWIIMVQKHTIEQLETYIGGQYYSPVSA